MNWNLESINAIMIDRLHQHIKQILLPLKLACRDSKHNFGFDFLTVLMQDIGSQLIVLRRQY